ncbi:unnamed protein product, partial [marine sediment metagenome]
DGKKLSDHLEKLNYKAICRQIGNSIAKLHDADIIHGDLTTSNMILVGEPTGKGASAPSSKKNIISNKKHIGGDLYFIDFGLGFISNRIENKAVDLHLIKQALEAKHFSIWEQCWQIISKNYNSENKQA